MPRIQHQLARTGETSSLFLFIDGKAETAPSSHWSYDRIVAKTLELQSRQDEDGVEPTNQEAADLLALFRPEEEANRHFEALGDRVRVRAGVIYVDGDPVDSALGDQILAFLKEGHSFEPLVKFYEKLLSNTSEDHPEAAENSRDQLYRFLAHNNFSITTEGDIIAYKTVTVSPDENGEVTYFSTRSGPAIVNGEPHEGGPVPQRDGDVVEMPRSKVTFDPSNACAAGLHVGGWTYFGSNGTPTIEVLVNPRDVVSVPHEYGNNKVRVCRYTILGRCYGERTDALVLPTPAEPPVPEPEVPVDSEATTFNTSLMEQPGFEDDDTAPRRAKLRSRLRDWLKGA